jgi:hypothetical protein
LFYTFVLHSFLQVKDDNGENHENVVACKVYVTRYFEKIYRVPAGAPEVFDNVIEEFLGQDICNSPLVRASGELQIS